MEGHVAVVGVSRGLWLGPDDFIGLGSSLQLSFPKDWPAVYGSKELKALIGKKGRLPAKRVAVAGEALLEDWKLLEKVKVYPLQSFSNALRIAEADRSLEVVKGWIVWECLDQFVAQRYWWNSKGDRWIDLSPRPLGVTQLLLVQAEGSHKEPELLRKEQADFAARLLAQFRGSPELRVAIDEKQEVAKKPAKSLDYSKWSNIVDSDDEDVHLDEDVGVKDLLEGAKAKKEPPLPDYLLGSTNGGGGTNCLTSLLKMLDSEQSQENAHQLAQVFGRSFHTAMLDQARQDFYRQALELLPPETFVVVLGLGSALPLLRAARRFQGVFLESSAALHRLGDELLRRHGLHGFAKATVALDDAAALAQVLRPLEKPTAVAVLTERMAHDLLSNGLVPCCLAAHQAVQEAWGLTARHIPQTVELLASPAEIRSDRLKELDIRPFNALRHTSSNDKADFWWWPVRMDNQPNTICSLLGPAKTLCGFDFDRSLDIGLEEVRRPLKLQATQRGRVNCAALWWLAKFEGLEYSTRPKLKDSKDSKDSYVRSEWKQAIHYLAGETSVFPGDVIELLVSITPRFTFRMMQQSPMAVEAPLWVQAPCSKRFSATLPILPYHFLMLTDTERLERYQEALIKTIGRLSARLKRRVRVLDAGCGIGLLGLSAALQGAEVYLCEALPLMRHVCREVVAANAGLVAEKRGLVQLLPPMMSTRLAAEELPKFDIVVSEVMDLWCLGEGIIPTMRHAHKKLLADGGVMLPSKLEIYVQPLEFSLWGPVEQAVDFQCDLTPLAEQFHSKFSALRIEHFPHKALAEPILAMEIDLRQLPQVTEGEANIEGVNLCIRMGGKPALKAQVSVARILQKGTLHGHALWWSADLDGTEVTNRPSSPQRSWKQLVRWLDQPRQVEKGEDVQVLTCFNEHQVNVEDIHLTEEMIEQYQKQQATLNVNP